MSSTTYSLLVHSCEGVSWIRRKSPNLYVAIHQDGQVVHRTPVLKRELAPKWEHLYPLPSDSPITLRLWHDSLLRCRDVCLGAVRTEISAMLELTRTEGEFIKLQLMSEDRGSNGKSPGTLLVRLVLKTEAASIAIEQAKRNVNKLALGAKPSAFMDTAGALGNCGAVGDTVGQLGDELVKIHPYANVAWKILTSVYQVVKAQQDTANKLSTLVKTMVSVYSFVKETDILAETIKKLEDKVLAIVKQTVECSLFIQEYTGHGFTARAIRNTWNNTDGTIDDLSNTLLKMKDSLESSLNVHGVFLSMQGLQLSTQVVQKLDSLAQLDALKTLNPVKMNAASRPTCLEGTRVQLLDEITEWLMDPTGSSSFLWLSGVAGSGKSTIATTISESFRGLQRLGVFLFFDRNDLTHSHPDRVIHTLAYSLACCNPHIGSAISAVIQRDPDIINAPLRTQFKTLLLEPLVDVEQHIHGPILIILDALDECGTPASRRSLLSIVSTEFPKLPRPFRFLITSRREADLAASFATHFAEKSIRTAASALDVRQFIYHEMERIRLDRKLGPAAWPKPTQMQAMIHLADGLFIWAATAIKFIDGYRPNNRLETLIAGKSTGLDALYSIALRNSAPWEDKAFKNDACAVLECVVFGKVPMTSETIDMLLGSSCLSEEVLTHLGCVIQWRPGCVARILHASFADYLMDSGRSEGQPWALDKKKAHNTLVLGCLRILHSQLKFNICGLEDSHILNVDVSGISSRVASCISPVLSYSSCFWGDHLTESPFDKMIMDDIVNFFHHNFLFWLEVISLLNKIPLVSPALTAAINYAKGQNDCLEDLILDAIKFVSAFGPVIAQSAPHIYLSAVPFAPRESRIARQSKKWFPNTVSFNGTLGMEWPAIQKVLVGHKNRVKSLDFSPDGTLLASGAAGAEDTTGSEDFTVCIWDTHTGQLVCGPLEGHTDDVMCVNFSSDSTQVVSGSRDSTCRIWDVQTGTLVVPLLEHIDPVRSVQFSPDGNQIVSACNDKAVRIWNAQTGALDAEPLLGHDGQIYAVRFSPDGMKIASGSADTTIRIWHSRTGELLACIFTGWDVQSVYFSVDATQIISQSLLRVCVWDAVTGTLVAGPWRGDGEHMNLSPDRRQIVGVVAKGRIAPGLGVWNFQSDTIVAGPFRGHTDFIETACFSPDGNLIASGSIDSTIRIWDVHANVTNISSFVHAVDSILLAPDGTLVASWSHNNTICVWDIETSVLVAAPFTGHTDEVIDVQFSLDSAQLASGSSDMTVRIWDLQTGTAIAGPLTGHTGSIQSICFSPDGTQLASGSTDMTVRVWDSQTGTLIAGPFTGHTSSIVSIHFSPDGTQIIARCDDKTVHIWDACTGALVAALFTDHISTISAVYFSPDGMQILSRSDNNTLHVWDTYTGALVSVFSVLSPGEIISVHFSPCGMQIASQSDGRVHVWNPQTGTLAGPLTGGHSGQIDSVQFSSDGMWLVSYDRWDKTVCVWNARTCTLVAAPFAGHTGPVRCVSFSPDRTKIVSGSWDRTVRVWDAQTGEPLSAPLKGHAEAPGRVSFSQDGRRIVSWSWAGDHTTVHIWKVEGINQIAKARQEGSSREDHQESLLFDADSGWTQNTTGALMFWVPPWLRERLSIPHSTLVISSKPTVTIDFSCFVHGTEWTKCIDQKWNPTRIPDEPSQGAHAEDPAL